MKTTDRWKSIFKNLSCKKFELNYGPGSSKIREIEAKLHIAGTEIRRINHNRNPYRESDAILRSKRIRQIRVNILIGILHGGVLFRSVGIFITM